MPLPTRQFASIALAVMLVLSAMPMAVAAGHEANSPLGVFDNTAEDSNRMETAEATVEATFERIEYTVETRVTGNIPDFVAELVPFASASDEATVDDNAASIKNEVNPHNASIQSYINTYVDNETNKSNYDVVRLDLQDEAGNERTIYAVGTVNDTTGNVTDFQVVNSSNRTVDYTLELSAFASQEFSEDIEWARENYVAEDQAPDDALRGRFAAKYAGGHIEVHEGEP